MNYQCIPFAHFAVEWLFSYFHFCWVDDVKEINTLSAGITCKWFLIFVVCILNLQFLPDKNFYLYMIEFISILILSSEFCIFTEVSS